MQKRRITLVALAAVAMIGVSVIPAAGAVSSVGGGAFGASVNVNALILPLNSGAMPSVSLPAEGGGPIQASALSTNLIGLVSLDVLKASTQGTVGPQGFAQSNAVVANVDVAGLLTVAKATSQCRADSNGVTGSAKIVDLSGIGIPLVALNPGPNTSLDLPIGRVVLNEQIETADSITVNAVHATLTVPVANADVVIGQSRCQLTQTG